MDERERWLFLRGPQTRPRASYNKMGIGQRKQVRGNPITWNMDCMGNCWPLLTLRGGQDQTSQALRTATVQGLKPKQTFLQSRGVIGVVERADSPGGSGAKSALQQQAVPDPAPSSDTSTSAPSASPTASTAPASSCPSGMYSVPSGTGTKCVVGFGRTVG